MLMPFRGSETGGLPSETFGTPAPAEFGANVDTVTLDIAEVKPLLTVTATLNVPSIVKVCAIGFPGDTEPSAKSQLKVSGRPPGSVAVAENVTGLPVIAAESDAATLLMVGAGL